MASQPNADELLRRDRISTAVNELTHDDLERFHAWSPLSDLSSRTIFEAIDADPASLILNGDGTFEIDAVVYVTLVYGPSRDEVSISDEYPAVITGRVTADGVDITAVTVDTASFYR